MSLYFAFLVNPMVRNAGEMVGAPRFELGFKAVVVCVDSRHLDESFAGKMLDPNSCNASPPALIPVEKTGSFIPSRSTVRSSPGGLSSSWGKPCGVTLSGLVICCLLNNLSKNLLERVGMRGL